MANSRCCRMVVAGAGSSRWITGIRLVVVGLVVAGAGLVSADAGRWSLVQDW